MAMIRVNLTPVDELESQHWYIADIVVALLVLGVGYLGLSMLISDKRSEIETLQADTNNYNENFVKISGDLTRINDLEKQIKELRKKLGSLREITVTQISRFKPVIVLEHIQNLKPEGAWLTNIELRADRTITIEGKAFDNLLVAEFMTALSSTRSQLVEPSDLRTQIYFGGIKLDISQVQSNVEKAAADAEPVDVPVFKLDGWYDEAAPTATSPSVTVSANEGSSDAASM
jgi:Tfp pilus assembly protein PilN